MAGKWKPPTGETLRIVIIEIDISDYNDNDYDFLNKRLRGQIEDLGGIEVMAIKHFSQLKTTLRIDTEDK